MNDLLEAITEGWRWKLGTPITLVATNRFGNTIVKNTDGDYFRIIPEEWQCVLLARSADALESLRATKEFSHDWEMAVLVSKAEAALGRLEDGEVYHLVIPGLLGGTYSVENIRKISLRELLTYSGDMAQQIEDVADGDTVTIIPSENAPNKAPEPTTTAVTPRAPLSVSE